MVKKMIKVGMSSLKCKVSDCGALFQESDIVHRRPKFGRTWTHKEPRILLSDIHKDIRGVYSTAEMGHEDNVLCCPECNTPHLLGFYVVRPI